MYQVIRLMPVIIELPYDELTENEQNSLGDTPENNEGVIITETGAYLKL